MSVFQFKKFTIHQDATAMKVGTDGVLLGAWAGAKQIGSSALDIGTGTGIIALMLAQKNPYTKIDAIESDAEAYRQAVENVAASEWHNTIHVHHSSLQDYLLHGNKRYDTLVCNPPYFNKGWLVDDPARKLARDAAHLPHTLLINAANQLLDESGNLFIILPSTEGALFIQEALLLKLYCVNKTHVFTKPGKIAKRLLLQFGKIQKQMEEHELLIADGSNNYTAAYRELTGDFYLNF